MWLNGIVGVEVGWTDSNEKGYREDEARYDAGERNLELLKDLCFSTYHGYYKDKFELYAPQMLAFAEEDPVANEEAIHDYYFYRARMFVNVEQWNAAIPYYLECMKFSKTYVYEIYHEVAGCYAYHNDLESAEKYLMMGIEKEREDGYWPNYIWKYAGWLLTHKGRPLEAIKLLEEYAEEEPKDSETYYYLGIAWESLAEHEKALNAYKKSIDLGATDPLVINNYCSCLYYQNADAGDEALALLTDILDKVVDDKEYDKTMILMNIIQIYHHKGDMEKMSYYMTLLDIINPDFGGFQLGEN